MARASVFVGSLTLLVEMKGHVGGGSGSDGLGASGARLKASLTCMSFKLLIHSNVNVQVGLPEMPALALVIPPGLGWRHKLESLIMAQNERWRHA